MPALTGVSLFYEVISRGVDLNLDQVVATLKRTFNESLHDGEQRKIIFWIDKDREFIEEIEQLSIDGVNIHQLTEQNQFYTKYLLEEERSDCALSCIHK
ncbi:hypothetical protein ACT7DA_30870 [Bacillus pacificus]